jgi:hypothetical protein
MVRFSEFWPVYLRHHSRSGTRAAHYAATAIGVGGFIAAVSPMAPWWVFVCGVALGYLTAFSSHWLIERNQPVVARGAHLVAFGAFADLRLCALAMTGGVAAEFRRLGLEPAKPAGGAADRATGA